MDVLYREHECLSLTIRLRRHRIKVVCFSPPVSEPPRAVLPDRMVERLTCDLPAWPSALSWSPGGPSVACRATASPPALCRADVSLAPHVSSLPTFHWPLTTIRDKSPPPVLSALESRVSALGSPKQAFQIGLQGSHLQQYLGPSDVLLTAGWGRNSHACCPPLSPHTSST